MFSLVITISFLTAAQNKFEGKVNIKLSSEDDTREVSYLIKGNKIRMELNNENASVLIDRDAKIMQVLIPDQKMYTEFSLNSFSPGQQKNRNSNEKSNGANYTKTNETKEILGYNTEKWTINDDNGHTEAWVAKDLGAFYFIGDNPMMPMQKEEWQSKLEDTGYFPLLVIHRNVAGLELSRFEVTSIEKANLSAELFSPPSDFNKMDISSMITK